MIVHDVDGNEVYTLKTSLFLKIHDLKNLTCGFGGLKELTE